MPNTTIINLPDPALVGTPAGTPARLTRRDEYRGNPLIILPMGRDREFSFGRGKAQAILEHLDDIRAFVAEIGV